MLGNPLFLLQDFTGRSQWQEAKGSGQHFRKGTSMTDLVRIFPDDETAEQRISERRWPGGPEYPHSGFKRVTIGCAQPGIGYRCSKDCLKPFSVRTGSVMADPQLGYQVRAIAMYLHAIGLKGTSSIKLHRDLNITQKSAWRLAPRIRESVDGEAGRVQRAGRT